MLKLDRERAFGFSNKGNARDHDVGQIGIDLGMIINATEWEYPWRRSHVGSDGHLGFHAGLDFNSRHYAHQLLRTERRLCFPIRAPGLRRYIGGVDRLP